MHTLLLTIMTFLGIIGFILYPVICWRWRFSSAPFFGIFTIIALLYIFGLFNSFLIGVYFIFSCSIVLSVISIYRIRKEFKKSITQLISPSFIIFFILFAFFAYLSHSWTLWNWDEFMHWGIFAKAMFLENKFHAQVGFVVWWPFYPPGMTILQYYVTKLVGSYSDQAVYFAQSIAILSAITVLFKDTSWKKSLLIVSAFLFGYWALYFWGYSVNNICQDGMLGLVFGATIMAYYSDEKRDWGAIIKTAPSLFVLPLIKELGIVFALIVAVIVIVDQLMTIGGWNTLLKTLFNKGNFQKLLKPISVLLIPLLSFISWKVALSLWKVPPPARNMNPFDLLKAFSMDATEGQRNAISGFMNTFQTTRIGFAPWAGVGIIIFFFILLFIYSIFKQEKKCKRGLNFQIFLIFGFLGYSALLLAFYILVDQTLGSYTRYIGTYYLGWSYVVFGIFYLEIRDNTHTIKQSHQKMVMVIICILFVLMAFALTPLSNIFTPLTPFPSNLIRQTIKQLLPYMEKNSRVWVILQNTNPEDSGSIEIHVIRYLIAPRTTESWCWSIAGSPLPGDRVTCQLSPKEWRDRIDKQNYNYVLVANPDDQLWQTYGQLFCGEDPESRYQLFKVEPDCFTKISP